MGKATEILNRRKKYGATYVDAEYDTTKSSKSASEILKDRRINKYREELNSFDIKPLYDYKDFGISEDKKREYKTTLSNYKTALENLKKYDSSIKEEDYNDYLQSIDSLASKFDVLSYYKTEDEYNNALRHNTYKDYSYDDIQKEINDLNTQKATGKDTDLDKTIDWLETYIYSKDYGSTGEYDKIIGNIDERLGFLRKEFNRVGSDATEAANLDAAEEASKIREEIASLENRRKNLIINRKEAKKKEEMDAYENEFVSAPDFEAKSVYTPSAPKTVEQLKADGYKLNPGGDGDASNPYSYYHVDITGKADNYTGEDSDLYTYLNNPELREHVERANTFDGRNDYQELGYDLIEEDEIKVYNYLYATKGEAAAWEYINKLRPTLQKRVLEEDAKELSAKVEENALNAIAYSVAEVGYNLVDAGAFIPKLVTTAMGESDNYQWLDTYGNKRDAVLGTVSTNIDENAGHFWSMAYSGGMSLANMGTALAIGGGSGKITQAIMSSSAGSSAISNAIANGRSDGEALILGLGSAAIEWATEKYSIEKLLNDPTSIGSYLWQNFYTEALEEGASNIGNIALDGLVSYITNSKSEIESTIDDLVLHGGLSKYEAGKKVFLQKANEFVEDMAIGGFTGLGMAGITLGTGAVGVAMEDAERTKQAGIDITDNKRVGDLVSVAKNTGNAKLMKLAEQVAGVNYEDLSTSQKNSYTKKVGKLQSKTLSVQGKSVKNVSRDTLTSIVSEKLKANGVAEGDISKASKVIVDFALNTNKRLSVKEDKIMKSVGGLSIVNELLNDENGEIQTEVRKAHQQRYLQAIETASLTSEKTKEKAIDTSDYSLSDDGKTYIKGTDEEVTVTGVSSINKGKMMVNLSNGKTEDIHNLDLGSQDDAIIYQGILDMGVDASVGQLIAKSYKGTGLDANTYILGVRDAIRYGKIGGKAFLADGTFTAELSEKMREDFYNIGDKYTTEAVKKKTEAQKAKGVKGAKGSVTFKGVDRNKLNSRQKASVNAIEATISGVMGINVVFFNSPVNDKGVHIGKNGSYNASTNTIELDISAGNHGTDVILFTAAHELTHYIAEWSPDKFKTFADFLVKQYHKHGVDLESLIQKKINDFGYDYDLAFEEVVADSCESFLRDSNLMKTLTALAKQDMTLFEKIKSYIDTLLERINKEYAGLTPDSREGREVLKMKDAIEELHDLWDEAALSAMENSQNAGGKKESSSPVKYDLREDFGEQLQDWQKGEGKKYGKYNGRYFALGSTPDILKKHGASDSEFIMYEDCLIKVTGGKHAISLEELAKLPKELNEPVLLFKGSVPNSFVALTEMVDKHGNDVIAIVHINKKFGRTIVNKIASVYSKSDEWGNNKIVSYINNQIKQGNLIDATKKAPNWFTTRGLQLPKVVQTILAANNIIDNSPKNVKENFEKNSERDNLGNQLSTAQAEYFKDSKVRDEDGNLKVMYRGDSNEFTVFDRKKTNYANLYGRGFYFTERKEHAEQYGKSREFYLNIKTPLSLKQNNITKSQMLKFLKAIENDGEDYDLYNYGMDATAQSVLTSVWGKGDYEMLQDISASAIGDLVAAVELFNEINGTTYDGIVLPTETITFYSEQAKLTSNKKPTVDKDIRYSYRESLEELNSQLREKQNQIYSAAMELKKFDSKAEQDKLYAVMDKEGVSQEEIDKALQEYSKWSIESGYNEAFKKQSALKDEEKALRREIQKIENKLHDELKEQIASFSDEDVKKYVSKAVRKYHTTSRLENASYLLTTGSMLDFSEGQGYRIKDHREISEILDLPDYAQYSDGMIAFMNMGNIRLQTYGIDVSAMPNSKQLSALRDIISKVMRDSDEFSVDFSKTDGYSAGSVTYGKGTSASKIIADIKAYFETGVVPDEQSNIRDFLYSERVTPEEDAAYMEAVNRGDTESAQRMVDEVAKKAGYAVKAYHGTSSFGFTKFDPAKSDDKTSLFFTDKIDVAKTYAGRDIYGVKSVAEAKSFKYERGKVYTEAELLAAHDVIQSKYHVYGLTKVNVEKQTLTHAGTRYSAKQIIEMADSIVKEGIYGVFLNTDNFLEVDAEYHGWSGIRNPLVNEWKYKINFQGEGDFNYFKAKADDMFRLELLKNGESVYSGTINFSEMHSLLRNAIGIRTEMAIRHATDGSGEGSSSFATAFSDKNGNYENPYINTRELAKQANKQGYNGVTIKNLFDYGGKNPPVAAKLHLSGKEGAATIYILFDSNQVKSADPVTYDADGNAIPLSERFNRENDDIRYSERVTDEETLDFLNKQIERGEYITVYRSFQVIDGGLYAPMNAVDRDDDGKNKRLGYRSEIGQWEMATESRAIAQRYMDSHPDAPYAKFDLDGGDNKTGGVAYNPYLHASNLVLNDQFAAAYRRNLVTVECRVPLSEAEGAYKAEYAKDGTGWANWKAGGVAGQLKKFKPELERRLFLSRYMLPVKILSDAEVAGMYKEYLDGTDIPVPWNVVTPSLRHELEKAGVNISYDDVKRSNGPLRFEEQFPNDIRNQERDPDQIKQLEQVNELLKTENAKLTDDVAKLKELVKLQRTETHGKMYTKSSLDIVAKNLMKKVNAKGDREELKKHLEDVYSYILQGEDVSWESVVERAENAVDWLMKNEYIETKRDEYADVILKDIRSSRFYLDDLQKKEVAYSYGSYNDYRKRNMGRFVLTDNANMSLDSQWQVWSTSYPGVFEADISSNDQPIRLAEIINNLQEEIAVDYYGDEQMSRQELLMDVYEGYWDISTLVTYADRKQKEINLLKHKHKEQMTKLRENHNDKASQLKKEYNEKLAKVRERSYEKQEAIAKRYQEARKKSIEDRSKTKLRGKIKNVVNELDNLLMHGNKDRNVKEDMQDVALAMLKSADAVFSTSHSNKKIAQGDVSQMILTEDERNKVMAYKSVLERIAKTKAKIKALNEEGTSDAKLLNTLYINLNNDENLAKHYDNMLEDVFERERIRISNVTVPQALKELADAYKSIQKSKYAYISNVYNPALAERLDDLSTDEGMNRPFKEMSLEQLDEVYDAYKMVLTSIRDANKVFAFDKAITVEKLGTSARTEIERIRTATKSNPALDFVRRQGWNMLKPIYVFRTIGSDTLTKLYENIRKGEDVWYEDVSEAKAYRNDMKQKYGYKSWDLEETYHFVSNNGKKFSLTLEQIMSLYALSRRSQSYDHLMQGGIVLEDAVEMKDGKTGKTYKVSTANTFTFTPELLNEVTKVVRENENLKGYVESMQEYLTKMGDKGNEISMQLFGVRLFKEKVYFPIKSSDTYMNFKPEEVGEFKIKNSSFTNATKKFANNPIVLSDFDSIWGGHINDMSLYHAFTLPLEDFTRVFNYRTRVDGELGQDAVRGALKNAYGDGAEKYIRDMLKDLNGGVRSQQGTEIANKLISLGKKASVFASASVVAQQPSAIARTFAYINPKYFANFKQFDYKHHNEAWEELKRYARVAGIKEMGYFDTGLGQSSVDWITQDNPENFREGVKAFFSKDSAYRDDVLSKLPALADELAWVSIWEAVKKEVADTYDKNADDYLKKCGDRFTEVITLTQVYDSVLSRSGFMRSKDTSVKMAVSFMAEPTTTMNMTYDAFVQNHRKTGKSNPAKVIPAILTAVIFNAILKALVTAGRDDDEDEAWLEKYLSATVDSFKDEINPLTYIPYVKDVVSLLAGYDVKRMDMTVIAQLIDSIQDVSKDSVPVYKKITGVIGAASSLFGVPLKNILRDIEGVFNTVKSFGVAPTSYGMGEAFIEGLTGKDTSKKDRAWNAYKKGDTSKVKETVNELVDDKVKSGKTAKEAKSAVRSSFTSTYKKKYLEAVENKDYNLMNEIRKFLHATGLYGSLSELDESLRDWRTSK